MSKLFYHILTATPHYEERQLRSNLVTTALTILALLLPLRLSAQWFGSSQEEIRTLRMMVNGDWERPPIVDMTQEELIEFSFDEMSHQYHRYTYHIEHCDGLWQPSDLLESDYMEGFNDQPIEEWENSHNTTFDYTHYSLTLPNNDVHLKLSGNYRLSVREDNVEVAWFRFCLSEGRKLISATVTTNTDIGMNQSHQQVNINVSYSSLTVRDPATELYTVVMQNLRTDNATVNPTPTYDSGNRLSYEHCRELVFSAGNEYRRFETVNLYSSFMNVDRISFHNPFYHATLTADTRRHAYKFDNDHNGRYLIRYNEATESDTEADYLFVHFALESEELTNGSLYVSGQFGGGNLSSKYKMEYNESQERYEATVLLKQGAYDYQYLWVPNGESVGQTDKVEGDWYETRNEYLTLLYYHPRNARYDRLISTQATKN